MIKLGNYDFEGPFSNTSDLKNQSGVYAILGTPDDKNVIDVGESGDVRKRVENHDREDCWRSKSSSLYYAAHYCDEAARMRIEKELRAQYNPPCGEE